MALGNKSRYALIQPVWFRTEPRRPIHFRVRIRNEVIVMLAVHDDTVTAGTKTGRVEIRQFSDIPPGDLPRRPSSPHGLFVIMR